MTLTTLTIRFELYSNGRIWIGLLKCRETWKAYPMSGQLCVLSSSGQLSRGLQPAASSGHQLFLSCPWLLRETPRGRSPACDEAMHDPLLVSPDPGYFQIQHHPLPVSPDPRYLQIPHHLQPVSPDRLCRPTTCVFRHLQSPSPIWSEHTMFVPI